jgi:two-component system cell cycle sensor histidine kinase/response regulator CckA
MVHNFFFTLRFRLVLLVLIALIPALGLIFYIGLEQRKLATIQAKKEALSLALFASNRQKQLVEGAHLFLDILAQLPPVRRCDPVACCNLITDLLKQYPHYLNIGAIGLDGYVFASALPPDKPIYAGDRTYFLRALKTHKFSIGEYQIGRITGRPGVNLGYPVMDDTGKVRAIVYVVLDLAWLNRLSEEADLPKDSTISLMDSDSTILARYPESEKWVGKTMPEASVVRTVLVKEEGVIETIGVDEVERLYAFTSFGSTVNQADKIYVSIGIPSSAVFAQANQIMTRNLAFLGFITLLALSAAWFGGNFLVLRQLNPTLSATERLGNGDLSARTGIAYGKGELSKLAFTFDEMARSLEQRDFERQQAAETLLRSEKRYRELANQLPETVFETDEKGNITFVNQKGLDVFGYTQDEFEQGLNAFQMIVPEEHDKAIEIFLKALTGEISEYEFTVQRKNGSTFFTIIHASPILQDNYPVGLRGIVVDITERKLAEEALRESENRYRTIFENTGTVIAIIEEDTTISLVNTEFEKLMGYSKEEIENKKSWTELVEQGSLERSKEYHHLRRIDPNLAPRSYELQLIAKDGNIRDTLATVSMIPRTKKSLASVLDITEFKRAEKEKAGLEDQFRQSQKMEAIGRLAGGIAHDFNNVMTVIKGYNQLSLIELKQEDPLRTNLEEIEKAIDRATDLTRQLLAFSRRQIFEVKVLNLNIVLQDLEKMLKRIIGEDIELANFLAEDLGKAKIDPGQIEQVIMNLAVNARDAMPNGGKFTIETANIVLDEEYARNHIAVKPGDYVMLSVSDTGSGMTPEVKEKVFEPFFTTKEKSKGTGLGLSTVYGIIKQSGGNIWVYSELGQGTTFKIYLPRVDEQAEELPEKPKIGEIPRGNETILIVEDDEPVRKLAARILKRQGYTVLEAHHEAEAISIGKERKEPIHIMLVDVIMPEVSGNQLVVSMRQVRQDFKVLYMSGYTDNAIVHHGILEKGVNYIQKPFTMDGLARKVREVLDKDSKSVV